MTTMPMRIRITRRCFYTLISKSSYTFFCKNGLLLPSVCCTKQLAQHQSRALLRSSERESTIYPVTLLTCSTTRLHIRLNSIILAWHATKTRGNLPFQSSDAMVYFLKFFALDKLAMYLYALSAVPLLYSVPPT
jgi:hypothetical protein